MSYRLSRQARDDLRAIWRYTATRWNVVQADAYLAEVNAALIQLAEGHRVSQQVEGLRQPYRRYLIGSHAIYFRSGASGEIRVARILHQNMDHPRHLR